MRILVTFRRKKRSVISMRLNKDGDISVSAPFGMTKEQVREFVSSHSDWIEEARAKFVESRERRNSFYDRLPLDTKEAVAEVNRRMDAIIPDLVRKYEKEMNVVVRRISYRASRTRWGSCNHRAHSVNFSVYLLLLPDWCIEHVVVHELAHLIEPNHSAAFYAIMDRHFPRWREARAETRRLTNK